MLQTTRQTDKQTDSNILPTPTDIVGVDNYNKKDGYRQRNVALVYAISLRHIIWLPQESHAGMSFGRWHLATSRESKAHFGLPWVRPCDNRGKFIHGSKENSMLVKRLAACTHIS